MKKFCANNARDILSRSGIAADPSNQSKIERALGAVIQRASLDLERLSRGESIYSQSPQQTAQNGSNVGQLKPVPFDALFKGWAAERHPAPKTVYEFGRTLGDLKTFLGHDDASRISSPDLIRWKEKMIEAGLAPKTILHTKLGPIKAVLQWAADNGKIPNNPAAKVSIGAKTRAGDSKRGFSDAEAATILGAAHNEADPVKRWIPLLSAYSGARVSELSQLRAQDIVKLEGVWCLRLAPEAGSLKTGSSERVVPLHPAIIKAGFLEFVSKLPNGPIFAELPPNRFGNRGGNATKILGKWVRDLGIVDKRISPSHSWRHRFKTECRRHGLPVDISDALTGHAKKTVASAYGEFPIEALYRELSKIPPIQID